MAKTFTFSKINPQILVYCHGALLSEEIFVRIVKMMIVVVVIFAVCWLPYHVYFLVALPCVLPGRPPPPPHPQRDVRAADLLDHLLAGHVQCVLQPLHILLDE
ncbi:hypothetical protein CDAR_402421 [Caerostris darwini]|uniref:Uncharacterized protein n=1 Tax=Caerostris darwini TaxID=1538125 RepID=A0AAV4VLM1_9ARAC|nr:hypothetical protein CDAR_402421 [Caerostris darwini]